MNKPPRATRFLLLILIVLILMAASFCLGAVPLSTAQIWQGLWEPSSRTGQILYVLRLPRILAALAAGSGLAVSGAILQKALHNPLAAPHVIGINAGAGLFCILSLLFFPYAWYLRAAASFTGAMAAALLILLLASRFRSSRTTLLMAGIAISQIALAFIDLIVSLFPDTLAGYSSFRIGSLAGLSLERMLPGLLLIGLGLFLALVWASRLELLSLGMDMARSLGLEAGRWLVLEILCAALLAGSAVSFAGLIGFVGLIVPHMASRIEKESTTWYLGACALLGAILLLAADLLSRLLLAPSEIPVGVVLALLGGPYFLYLLFSGKRRGK